MWLTLPGIGGPESGPVNTIEIALHSRYTPLDYGGFGGGRLLVHLALGVRLELATL